MKIQIRIQQGWAGAEILVSNRHPGEAASLCPGGLSGAHRARSTPKGEEEARGGGATLEGSRESSLHIRDTNLSWVDRF